MTTRAGTFALWMTMWMTMSILPAQIQTAAKLPGTVHIYRLRLSVGTTAHPTVSCDDFPVVRIQNGRVYSMKVSAGRHSISAGGNPIGITVDVDSGKEYFVRIDFPPGVSFRQGATPVLVPADEGRMETLKLRPLDERYVEAATCGRP